MTLEKCALVLERINGLETYFGDRRRGGRVLSAKQRRGSRKDSRRVLRAMTGVVVALRRAKVEAAIYREAFLVSFSSTWWEKTMGAR